MNLLSAVISFLLLPILIIGFLTIIEERRRKQIKKALEKAIGQLVKENNLTMTEIDCFRNKAIGIDRKNKKLVFVDLHKEFVDQFCIDLETLVLCHVVKILDESSKHVKNVFIEVKNKNINQLSRLTFYNIASDSTYAKASLIRRAEHWKNKINFYGTSRRFDVQFEYVL